MADEDITIEVGAAVRRHIERRTSPLSDPGKAVTPYDSPDADPIPVFIAEEVMKSIERQTRANKEREVGGVLLGGFYRNDTGSFVEVTDFIEAESAKGTDVSLTFTHESWERIHERIALRGEGVQMVGWYHSHPALGVFMSKEDEFIHTSYFSDPWHIAIVHDPIYTNWGCFKWADGKLDRTGGFYVFGEKNQAKRVRDYVRSQITNRQSAPRSASASAERLPAKSKESRSSVWSALLVMLIIQIAVMWIWSSRLQPAPQESPYETAMRLLGVSDLSGAEGYLRQELSLHPDNAEAYEDLRKLSRAMARPSVVNADHDRRNLLLYSGSRIAAEAGAKGSPGTRMSKAPEESKPAGKTSMTADYAGRDMVADVLRDYESAASTRSARIARAKAVDAVAKAKWSREAVTWLRNEELRQIAYGRISAPMDYAKRYKGLSPKDRKVVDAVLGSGR